MKQEEIKKVLREKYGKIAHVSGSCCERETTPKENNGCCPGNSCCGPNIEVEGADSGNLTGKIGKEIGYSEEELESVPMGSNLNLGCGNPVALATLKEGEVVLDLGSGAGFDCFLARERVGETGRVIGVDMTAEMLEKARENIEKTEYNNVEFRLGEIENLPVADGEVDVIISNCVINLSTDKPRVFREAYRALRPGGRIMVSDIALNQELPRFIAESVTAYVGCVAGAMLKSDYIDAIKSAGFNDVKVISETPFMLDELLDDPAVQSLMKDAGISKDEAKEVSESVFSVNVHGIKVA